MFDWQKFSQECQSIYDSGAAKTQRQSGKRSKRRSEPMRGQSPLPEGKSQKGSYDELVISGDPADLQLLTQALDRAGAFVHADGNIEIVS